MATLTLIRQTEVTECGLACLAMIGNYHGHDIDLAALRKRYSVSLRGASLGGIMAIAKAIKLSPRALTLDMEHLPKLALPAILHWDMDHFVVLKSVDKRYAIIHDPGRGIVKLSLTELSKHFTGVALELSPAQDFTQLSDKTPLRLSMLWSRLTGLKRAIGQVLLLSIILQVLVLASPFYLQFVIDGALPRQDMSLLTALAIGFGGLMVLRAISEATRGWAVLVYGQQMSLQMAGNVVRHLLRLPMSYFEKRHIGDVISRINSTQPIQMALSRDVAAIVIDGAMALLTLGIMFLFSPVLTLIVVVTSLLMTAVTLLLYPKLRAAQETAILARAQENSHVIESLRAVTALKLFGREAERESGWRNLFAGYVNANLHYGKLGLWHSFAHTLLTGLQLILVVYIGAQDVMGGPIILGQDPGQALAEGAALSPAGSHMGLTLGMLFAFLMFRQMFASAIGQLLSKLIEFRLLGLHLERLSDIILAKPDVSPPAGVPPKMDGDIVLENVSFRYSALDPWVLRHVNLRFCAGQMSALEGPSGQGKTTLLKLMLGLYAPTEGRVLIGETDIRQIDMAAYRAQIGVVMQDDALLSGTLADNIAFFDPALDMGKVRSAANAAQIDTEIMAMPMNYRSRIGDMGSSLSGGQRQRVLLARALYQNPKILFLDEGTANLDLETERLVAKTLETLPATRIVIAHGTVISDASDQLISI